jgi:hypothetical protein
MPSPSKQPTQAELQTNTREFGGEMNQIEKLTAQLATVVNTLIPALEHIERIAANGGNGNSLGGPRHGFVPGLPTCVVDRGLLGSAGLCGVLWERGVLSERSGYAKRHPKKCREKIFHGRLPMVVG